MSYDDDENSLPYRIMRIRRVIQIWKDFYKKDKNGS
jgi:hypothetical protein